MHPLLKTIEHMSMSIKVFFCLLLFMTLTSCSFDFQSLKYYCLQSIYTHSLISPFFTCNLLCPMDKFSCMRPRQSLPQFPGRHLLIQIMWLWRWGMFFPTAKSHDVRFKQLIYISVPMIFFISSAQKLPNAVSVGPSLTLTHSGSFVRPSLWPASLERSGPVDNKSYPRKRGELILDTLRGLPEDIEIHLSGNNNPIKQANYKSS